MTYSVNIDAVSKAKQAYVIAKTTLEARLREQMRDELANLQTQIDIAVRYAINAGESKAAVLRALGTKDYGTLNASLGRTQGVSEVKGIDPLDSVYGFEVTDDGDRFFYATYVNHGSKDYNGKAKFRIKSLAGGGIMFLSDTPLWNDDYTVRNDAVVALDGRNDGEYYEEAVSWFMGLTS